VSGKSICIDPQGIADRVVHCREKKIPVYPALGNHDLHEKEEVALGNYFQRFPDLKKSRYYSVRAANSLILVLDSSLVETTGPQGQWLADNLDHVPSDMDFVFVMDHHPAYTSSSEEKKYGGGHSARPAEQGLAKMLEELQPHAAFRIVVFPGTFTTTSAMSITGSLIS
jgi:hypothetical protein